MNFASLRVQPKRGFFTASERLSYAVSNSVYALRIDIAG